ncbi:ArsA-related P-loop ATPase [Dermatophilaceae bacterium Soc4.6]
MPDPSSLPWARARLHVVTGKGGTGKTTVAAALALALASGGKRVLLVEVEGRQGLSQTFDVGPLSIAETRLARAPGGGEVMGLSVDAKAALLEYLQIFYKLGRAGGVLERFGAIDFATTIAPGVRDVLLIGKVYEANRRHKDGRRTDPVEGDMVYDAIVLDAPPTGRVVRFLSVNEEVADLARMGPIKGQADSITNMLRSGQSVVHVVTLLEDMPVQETADSVADLRAARMPVGAVVVNQVRPPILPDRQLRAAARGRVDRDAIRAGLETAGLATTDVVVDGLVTEARDHARRVALETELRTRVDELGMPVFSLPALTDGIDVSAIRELADLLLGQGMVS